MISQSRSLFLLPLALLAGCGTGPAPTAPVTSPNLTGNWQIQSANVSATSPAAQVVLFGALQNSTANSGVTGTFRFSNLAHPLNCPLSQVVTLSGTVDSSENLNLSSPTSASGVAIKVQLRPSTIPAGFENGTIEVDSPAACALASSPAIGTEIAPVNGTFNGQLIGGALGGGASVAGTASLVVSQSSTPAADGQFPLIGTIDYVLGTCSGTVALSGDASGVGVTLAAAAAPFTLPPVSILGTTDSAADKIDLVSAGLGLVSCTGTPPAANVFSGTLNRQ